MNTPSIALHSVNPDSAWHASKLGKTYASRIALLDILRRRGWYTTYAVLNTIPKYDIRSLATVLNDCPEFSRKKALEQLQKSSPNGYSECIRAISQFQIHKDTLDPAGLFPCVATQDSIINRGYPKNCCRICNREFEEGDDILWKNCKQHALHCKCTDSSALKGAVAFCNECNLLPVELHENSIKYLPAKEAMAWREVPALSQIIEDRLDPAVYLSSAFLYSVSLLATMADSGCVLGGSRALDFQIPGSAGEMSDWDFYVNGYASCVIRMIAALESSGVEWEDKLADRVRRLVYGEESSIGIWVGEAQNVCSWGGYESGDSDVDDFCNTELPKALHDISNRSLSRKAEIKVSRSNDKFEFEFPEEDDDVTQQGEEDPSTSSGGGDFSVLTGQVSKNGRRFKVQLIICHVYGNPQSCLQVISRFHSTPVQCFLGGFGAGHMFYNEAAGKTGTVWPKELSPKRALVRNSAIEKYEKRGYKMEQQKAGWPPVALRLGDIGSFYMPYTKLYEWFESFKRVDSRRTHPVKEFLTGLMWGLNSITWILEEDGPRHVTHRLLAKARESPRELLAESPDNYPVDILKRARAMQVDRKGHNTFRLADYVSTYAPPHVSGVKRSADVRRLDRARWKMVSSGLVGRLTESSPISHLL